MLAIATSLSISIVIIIVSLFISYTSKCTLPFLVSARVNYSIWVKMENGRKNI